MIYISNIKKRAALFDIDAVNFMTATAIPNDATIFHAGTPQEIDGHNLWIALNNLVVSEKDSNLYSPLWYGYDVSKTKILAQYPFIGGSAFSHKWNACDPRDLDAAFRLTFYGGLTHSGTGCLPNGSNGYADTHLVPNVSLSLNSTHLSYYSRTNGQDSVEIGCIEGSVLQLAIRYSNLFVFNTNDNSSVFYNNVIEKGFFISSRIQNNVVNSYINTTNRNISSNSTLLNLNNIYVFARQQNNETNNFSNKECAFASIGTGLTDTDALNLYNIVQQYQTMLGRNVY